LLPVYLKRSEAGSKVRPKGKIMKLLPIGRSDFKSLREDDRYFVDKSLFIKEIINDSSDIILLPRPRRFGKTLNLTMLRNFF
jgi:hypothetical protein